MSGIIRGQAVSEYVMAVARIKNRGFRAEREIRYIVSQPQDSGVIHTRSGRYSSDTTHVKLTGAPDGMTKSRTPETGLCSSRRPSACPFVKVRLGPALKGKAAVREVEEAPTANGYHNVEVVKSRSTQR